MQTTVHTTWLTANQQHLTAALALIRSTIARSVGLSDWVEDETQLRQALQAAKAALPALSALEQLSRLFGLSAFEEDILLLCAGMELDARFVRLCALSQSDPQRAYPTFSLALSALANPHWDALTPTAPLRHYHLIEIGQGTTLTLSPLRINERILHYLTGTQYLDIRLFGLVERVKQGTDLVPSQQQQIAQIEAALTNALSAEPPPVIQLCGSETLSKRSLVMQVCERLHFKLWQISAQTVPTLPAELEQFCRLWTRETLLNASVLLLDCDHFDPDPLQLARLTQLVERLPSLLFISSRERLPLPQRPVVHLEIHKPTAAEQILAWQTALPAESAESFSQIQTLVSQFNLNTATIHTLSSRLKASGHSPDFRALWTACRIQARPRLDELAQRIEPSASWQDLVLPEAQTQILRSAAAHVGQRSRVYEQWGFAAKGNRGLGISALFAGASGTGKTLAAEVLAHQLHLDLYRVDLSSVVSKYIGETEKNLRRVFDAATEGGVILLFDEADALFGKRSEVKDSRDRYANIEVSYLLQRMECYPGLAILTTNLKSALDTAFLRRIRFVVQFPFPDAAQRAEIWRRIFPADTPTQNLDPLKLAQLNIAGGNIRNVALNAAFLAADAGEPVQMHHLLQAARTEYAKLEKTLTESEIGGWI
ncbi:MAG: ATP-binding protein [Cyanobacteria bacterium RM1_2_2]|nr:ATP-binding protein [Cyanobacteria bacterium RM1_2_2]